MDFLGFLAGHIPPVRLGGSAGDIAGIVASVTQRVNDAKVVHSGAFAPSLHCFLTVPSPASAPWLSLKTRLHELHLCRCNEHIGTILLRNKCGTQFAPIYYR